MDNFLAGKRLQVSATQCSLPASVVQYQALYFACGQVTGRWAVGRSNSGSAMAKVDAAIISFSEHRLGLDARCPWSIGNQGRCVSVDHCGAQGAFPHQPRWGISYV